MRIIERYLGKDRLTLPNKWCSKSFVYLEEARRIKKLERTNRRNGRKHNVK